MGVCGGNERLATGGSGVGPGVRVGGWLVALVVLAVAPAGCRGLRAGDMRAVREGRRLEVQGHRGCRGLRPENTMAAFEHAVELGVDVLELDVGLTHDGVLAVIHDPDVKEELCKGAEALPTRRVRNLTFGQLLELDCGSRRHPDYPEQIPVPGARVPRIEQVLDLVARHPGVGANIEIKTFPDRPTQTWPPARFARILVPLIEVRGLERRVTVQSFDPAALRAVATLSQAITLAALADKREDFDPLLSGTRARILSPRHTELRREDVARLHARKVRVIPWTVNTPDRMRELIAWGVDGIITDRPDLLLEVTGRRPTP